jgi:tRNA nucleotidyltransferase (CCA-adding enzyme)
MADYKYMMESRLSPDQQRAVALVQELARAHEMNLYLVGGALRDMMTGFPIRDLDLALQGNPFKLQKDLEKAGVVIQGSDEERRILYVAFAGNVRGEISATRWEKYDKPGKAPEIGFGTILEDLRRRDFSVNAMALSLNEGSYALLLDPFNGTADIELKVLRILHNYAFLEEPSRLLRAVRFSARFHWPLEERTQARFEAAREGEYMQYILHDAIGYEIEHLAYEDDPLPILRAYEKEGWLKLLNPHWSIAKVDTSGLNDLLKTRQQMTELGYTVDAAPAEMHFLTARLPAKDVADIQRLIPRKDFVQRWRRLDDEARALAHLLTGKEAATPSRAWHVLSAARPESILFLAVTTRNHAVAQKLKNFFGKWRQMKEKLPLPEMTELRITPELPVYPKLAEEAFFLLLDGKLHSRTEILKFLKPYAPPPPPPPPAAKRGRKGAEAHAAPVAAPEAAATAGKRGRKAKAGAAPAAPPAPPPAEKAAPAHKSAPAAPEGAKKIQPKAAAKAKPKPAAKQASKPAAKQASKPAKKQAPKPAKKKKK